MRNPTVRPLWALLTVLGAFPLVGSLMAIAAHDAAFFYVSLAGVPLTIAVVVLALTVYWCVLRFVLPALLLPFVRSRRQLVTPKSHTRTDA